MDTQYSRRTVEGDKKTEWICGCFQTADGFFKFCGKHDDTMTGVIREKIDELDMTLAVD